jgi:hypothetical protein
MRFTVLMPVNTSEVKKALDFARVTYISQFNTSKERSFFLPSIDGTSGGPHPGVLMSSSQQIFNLRKSHNIAVGPDRVYKLKGRSAYIQNIYLASAGNLTLLKEAMTQNVRISQLPNHADNPRITSIIVDFVFCPYFDGIKVNDYDNVSIPVIKPITYDEQALDSLSTLFSLGSHFDYISVDDTHATITVDPVFFSNFMSRIEKNVGRENTEFLLATLETYTDARLVRNSDGGGRMSTGSGKYSQSTDSLGKVLERNNQVRKAFIKFGLKRAALTAGRIAIKLILKV